MRMREYHCCGFGSNATLSAYDIDEEVYVADKEDVYLMQLEIPVGTVEYVAQKYPTKETGSY